MPWQVPAPRTGREWVRSPDPEVLRRRWERLAGATPQERRLLFRPTRARTADSPSGQLPGSRGATARLSRDPGPFPEPVRVRCGAFDRQWLLADQRLLDAPRPELWRVADDAQVFLTLLPAPDGPVAAFSAELPLASGPGRAGGRVAPLFRRPGGREPNLAPGLAEVLSGAFAAEVAALDVLAWVAAVTALPRAADPAGTAAPAGITAPGGSAPADPAIPLPRAVELWARGVELGRRILWLHTFGARAAAPDRPPGPPRMPGGRRPFVRQAFAGLPRTIGYDPDHEALLIGGEGRISPVAPGAWALRGESGEPALAAWFGRRADRDWEPLPAPGEADPAPAPASPAGAGRRVLPAQHRRRAPGGHQPGLLPEPQPEPATALGPDTEPAAGPEPAAEPGAGDPLPLPLEAVLPAEWPRLWTTELTELASVLALLAELAPELRAFGRELTAAPTLAAAELRRRGVLPVPPAARRPASVLGTAEEGPEGQFALL